MVNDFRETSEDNSKRWAHYAMYWKEGNMGVRTDTKMQGLAPDLENKTVMDYIKIRHDVSIYLFPFVMVLLD